MMTENRHYSLVEGQKCQCIQFIGFRIKNYQKIIMLALSGPNTLWD